MILKNARPQNLFKTTVAATWAGTETITIESVVNGRPRIVLPVATDAVVYHVYRNSERFATYFPGTLTHLTIETAFENDTITVEAQGGDGIITTTGPSIVYGQTVPTTSEPTFNVLRAFGGGTYQCRNISPDGLWECEGSDVGGLRRRMVGDTAWENLPTAGNDADRKVAGCIILNDGTMFSLVGNGTGSGRLLEYQTDGNVVVLETGLFVLANNKSTGDVYARTRPVGWMLHFDDVHNLIYVLEGDGLYRFDRTAGTGSRIALNGTILRGIVHNNAITVGAVTDLTICTHDRGVARVNDVRGLNGFPNATELGTPTRAEDGAFTPGGNIIAACHFQGVHRIDPITGNSVNITPDEVVNAHNNKGANNGDVLWSAVDVNSSGIAVAVMINPPNANGWVYRTTASADTATSSDWESITHTQMTLLNGVGYVQPKNRTVGGSAENGVGLTGLQHVSFTPDGKLKVQGTLTTAISDNWDTADHTAVTWVSDVENSSLLSMLDVAVSDTGAICISMADHNTMTSPGIASAVSTELDRVGVSGLGDGKGLAFVSGIWVFCPVDDAHWEHAQHTWMFYAGQDAPSGWTSMGWESYDWNNADDFPAGLVALPAGIPPRPVSVCGFDAGTYIRFLGAADGIGFVYQDYLKASALWTDPAISQNGPVTDVISQRLNTTRVSECTADGSVVLHILQKNGHVYRSLDQGATVERIATGSNGPEIAAAPLERTGYARISNDGTFAVLSNRDGIYLIKNLTAADPEVVQLSSSETGPIAVDPISDDVFIHLRGSGPCELLRFSDISNDTDLSNGVDAANDKYKTHLSDQANQVVALDNNGATCLITLYQGGGASTLSYEVAPKKQVFTANIRAV